MPWLLKFVESGLRKSLSMMEKLKALGADPDRRRMLVGVLLAVGGTLLLFLLYFIFPFRWWQWLLGEA